LTIFLLIIGLLILCVYLFTRSSKEKSGGSWLQFFSKGKDEGFTIKELEQIRRFMVNSNIKDPVSIFSSQKDLENCIRSIVNAMRISGESNNPLTQEFLSRLFDYYKKVEMRNSEKKTTITNSRLISEGQALRILVPGTGVFKSEVIKNNSNHLTISRPVNAKITSTMQWNGISLSVYFWREGDAGYVFDTSVADEVFSKGISSIKVEHNDSLFRTQKRKSLRVKLSKPAFVYMLSEGDVHNLETSEGLKCMLEDISDTGCAFRVKGKADSGLRLKIQFSLNNIPLCIPGTVRSVDYKPETNVSRVHMEAEPLPLITRNQIMSEIFDLLSDEDDDELPFRIMEEEILAGTGTGEIPRSFQEVMNE